MADRLDITSPVGRIVAGSLYKPNTTDFDGKPLVYKTGADAGKPRVNFFFAIAIPKAPGETHWGFTEWGKQIWEFGNKAFPSAAQRPDFSWKIEDGDSTIPNKKNRKPCENEGWPGNWIIKLSNGFAPTIYRQEGTSWLQLTEPDAVKPGYFVQVQFAVDQNGQQANPGVYLNPGMICFRAYGPEISFGPNVEDAGFGNAPLPPGASMAPVAATTLPAAPAPPTSAAPVPIYPNPNFAQMPPNPVMPANGPGAGSPAAGVIPAPPAPASPSKQMTAKAGAITYQAYVAAGWSDAMLIANGLMTA